MDSVDKEVEQRRRKPPQVQEEKSPSRVRKQRLRIRLIPIWFRIIMVLALMIAFTCAGTMVGYGVIGNGKPLDVFKQSTWQHIVDIVVKEK